MVEPSSLSGDRGRPLSRSSTISLNELTTLVEKVSAGRDPSREKKAIHCSLQPIVQVAASLRDAFRAQNRTLHGVLFNGPHFRVVTKLFDSKLLTAHP